MLLDLDMFLSVRMNVPLCQAEVYSVDFVNGLVESNKKVLGFDVSMNEPPLMYSLYSSNLDQL